MDLGTFSVSLSVKDIGASRAFYERLGFVVVDGAVEHKWVVMRNGDAHVGLFQDKFEGNLLTFNPRDVRAIQARLQASGASFTMTADESTSGPACAVLADPDGNVILLDQH